MKGRYCNASSYRKFEGTLHRSHGPPATGKSTKPKCHAIAGMKSNAEFFLQRQLHQPKKGKNQSFVIQKGKAILLKLAKLLELLDQKWNSLWQSVAKVKVKRI